MEAVTAREPAGSAQDLIKVWFRFVPRENWLPYDEEGMWAIPLGDDVVQIDNIPFLVPGVAQEDRVRITTDADGLHRAVERVEWSGNFTIRVLPEHDGPIGPSVQAVREQFTPFGVTAEGFSADLPLTALNIPADADLSAVKALLQQGQEAGWWWYEEACIGDAWREA